METQQIAISDSISWRSTDTGQLEPNQGRTGIHPGYTNQLPAVKAQAENQLCSGPRSKETQCLFNRRIFSKRLIQLVNWDLALVKTTAHQRGVQPGHLRLHSPAGTKTRISFILHEFKKAASRGGYCIAPLGAVGNSTSSSDRCTVQHSQLLICN